MRPHELRWASVRVGLFVALALFVAFALVAALGVSGSPLTRRVRLHGQFEELSGLAVGSPVEMGGVIIGEIDDVSLPDIETGRVPVRLAIDPGALSRIGPSSEGYTGSHALVGQRFVGITPRKPDEPALKDGDTVRTAVKPSTESLMDDAREALTDVRALVKELRGLSGPLARLGEKLDKGEGTLGRLAGDDLLYESLLRAARQAEAMTDPALARELRQASQSLARTMSRVEAGEGVLGRLTSNARSTRHIDRALENVALVSDRLVEAKGTLGALINDPALLEKMNRLLGEMDAMVADMRRNPQRYIKLEPF
jgi:phospholipid/cholesterol/gamma-HCH transport system substrate-binding protein